MTETEMTSLCFECVRCGACCSGEPGLILFSPAELEGMSRFLAVSKRDFLKTYARPAEYQGKGVMTLKEKENGDCVFFDAEKGCLIYEVRPLQCRSYPFWSRILKSRFSWKTESLHCPGMNQGSPASLERVGEWIALERREEFVAPQDEW